MSLRRSPARAESDYLFLSPPPLGTVQAVYYSPACQCLSVLTLLYSTLSLSQSHRIMGWGNFSLTPYPFFPHVCNIRGGGGANRLWGLECGRQAGQVGGHSRKEGEREDSQTRPQAPFQTAGPRINFFKCWYLPCKEAPKCQCVYP